MERLGDETNLGLEVSLRCLELRLHDLQLLANGYCTAMHERNILIDLGERGLHEVALITALPDLRLCHLGVLLECSTHIGDLLEHGVAVPLINYWGTYTISLNSWSSFCSMVVCTCALSVSRVWMSLITVPSSNLL
jgi:hypothetical protein